MLLDKFKCYANTSKSYRVYFIALHVSQRNDAILVQFKHFGIAEPRQAAVNASQLNL